MEIKWTELVILLGSAILCIIFYIKWAYSYWNRLNVPYIKPSFPFGNFEIPWAVKKGFHEVMLDIYKELRAKGSRHGGIFSMLVPIYVPVDLDLLKNIFIRDFQHFVDRGLYHDEKADPLSAHLVNLEGEKWKDLRNKLSPTFTSGKMKTMFHLMVNCGDGLEKEVDALWRNKEPVDIKEMGALFTTNVIGVCAFGLDCNCFEDPNNEFRIYSKQIFASDGFVRGLKRISAVVFPRLCKKLGLKMVPQDAAKFFMKVTKDIIDHRESSNVKRNDFVDLLLEINRDAKGIEDTITFEEMAAQAFVFFLAGFETSSSTMTFTFYELARNQEIQNKVREEINRILLKYNGKLTYDAVMEMTYMNQVFDETLRKYPIAATLIRKCTKDYKVPGEDVVVKKGTRVMISLKGIHNDPEYYPDPDRFDPERFTPENKANRHVCAYMPFGEGPRICIGMRFGIMQAKVGMAIMLRNYRYTLNPKMPAMTLNNRSPLLSPKQSIFLDIEKIEK